MRREGKAYESAERTPRIRFSMRLLAVTLIFSLLLGSAVGCGNAVGPEGHLGQNIESPTKPAGGSTSSQAGTASNSKNSAANKTSSDFDLTAIPEYSGKAYVEVNDNEPSFAEEEITNQSFEEYAELDQLGRCGAALACLGSDLMPTEERGDIREIKPSGWRAIRYDFVDGESLYNRCHLIGYQLTAENANEKNLITGTRYMNVEGMLPFENMVADYIKETDNHVMYRVTPIFDGNNLLASGVHMEALSVEDGGESISFNVYCYNVQPGVEIDYADGRSRLEKPSDKKESNETSRDPNQSAQESTDQTSGTQSAQRGEITYVINKNTNKFHYPTCPSVDEMKEKNRIDSTATRDELIDMGYEPCSQCKP